MTRATGVAWVVTVTRTAIVTRATGVVVGLRPWRVVARDMAVGVVVGRIATVVVVITVCVVDRIRWRQRSVGMRWVHHRVIAVVEEAVVAGTIVVMRTGTDVDHHPRLIMVSVPAEANRFEVFEGGEAVKFIVQFVVRHHRVGHRRIRAVSRDGDFDSLDGTSPDLHVL